MSLVLLVGRSSLKPWPRQQSTALRGNIECNADEQAVVKPKTREKKLLSEPMIGATTCYVGEEELWYNRIIIMSWGKKTLYTTITDFIYWSKAEALINPWNCRTTVMFSCLSMMLSHQTIGLTKYFFNISINDRVISGWLSVESPKNILIVARTFVFRLDEIFKCYQRFNSTF